MNKSLVPVGVVDDSTIFASDRLLAVFDESPVQSIEPCHEAGWVQGTFGQRVLEAVSEWDCFSELEGEIFRYEDDL